MRHLSAGSGSRRPLAVAVVMLVGFALLLCLVHINHDEGGLHMLHGACGVALVAWCVTSLAFVSVSWWLLPHLAVPAYAVSLHLQDPPPKAPPLL